MFQWFETLISSQHSHILKDSPRLRELQPNSDWLSFYHSWMEDQESFQSLGCSCIADIADFIIFHQWKMQSRLRSNTWFGVEKGSNAICSRI